jgi:DNA polymerase I
MISTNESSIVYLVDGTGYFFRSYYGMPDLRRQSDGMMTNAVFGFLQAIKRLTKKHQPTHLAVMLDSQEPTFREDLFADYKKNRIAPPDDLIVQFPYLERLIEALGIPCFKMPGWEADDLLGTVARIVNESGHEAYILTGDKDMLQLVSPHTRVERDTPRGSIIYDVEAVQKRYRCDPERLVDVMGLMGDSSDNIPGVPGIGEKTAINLIEQFGNIDEVLANIDSISGKKRKENLEKYSEQAKLSRELATIRTDADVKVEMDGLRQRPVNAAALRELLTELEMHNQVKELGVAESSSECEYEAVDTEEKLAALAEKLKASSGFAFDTETTGLDAMGSGLVGMSFSTEAGKGDYVPIQHAEGACIELGRALDVLGPILEDPKMPKWGHNIKFDYLVMRNHGVTMRGLDLDTLIAHYLMESSGGNRKLDQLALRYLNLQMIPIDELIGKGTYRECMNQVPVSEVVRYAAEDADACLRLRERFLPELREKELEPLLGDVEMPLVVVLADMEAEGVHLDVALLEAQNSEIGKEIIRLAEAVFQMVGKEFNLNSPSQLGKVLFDDMGLPSGRKRSTRADVLEGMARSGVEIAGLVVEYRQLTKLRSTYLEALPRQIRKDTGKLHTSYNQAVVNTGRISSSNPNLQNIPIRTELGKRVREAFVASPGNVLLSSDYSQVELRVLAHLSGDEALCDAFAKGQDIHARTASEIFGVSLQEVTSEQRGKAKAINFGLVYGMGSFGLSERLGISRSEAQDYIDRYFGRYCGVKGYVDGVLAEAAEQGYVRTLLGRRIDVGGINSPKRMEAQNASRVATNAPVQGSAADLLKKAMVGVHRRLKDFRSRLILTVHDEVVLDCPQDELEPVRTLVEEEMTGAMSLSVPLEVDMHWGSNWAALK